MPAPAVARPRCRRGRARCSSAPPPARPAAFSDPKSTYSRRCPSSSLAFLCSSRRLLAVATAAARAGGGWPRSSSARRSGEPDCRVSQKKLGATGNFNLSEKATLQSLQGSQPCGYYAQHGFCKFGPTCKFDHPMGSLSYSPSVSELTDVPFAPYHHSFPVAPGTTYGHAGTISKVYAPHTLIRSSVSAGMQAS